MSVVLSAPLVMINNWLLKRPLDIQTTWASFALVMAQVGAYYALRRSNETRAYLGEVRLLLQEVSARSVLSSASSSHDLWSIESTDMLKSRATQILRHLMDSRLFPSAISAFSVWARDDRAGVWRIVAALGASEQTIVNFTQPILLEETDGAGVVANLAVAVGSTGSYYQPAATKAPNRWFMADPAVPGALVETLAVFMLTDSGGIPVGAFAMTSKKEDALEGGGERLSERLRLIIDQCTISLVGVARRMQALWADGDTDG